MALIYIAVGWIGVFVLAKIIYYSFAFSLAVTLNFQSHAESITPSKLNVAAKFSRIVTDNRFAYSSDSENTYVLGLEDFFKGLPRSEWLASGNLIEQKRNQFLIENNISLAELANIYADVVLDLSSGSVVLENLISTDPSLRRSLEDIAVTLFFEEGYRHLSPGLNAATSNTNLFALSYPPAVLSVLGPVVQRQLLATVKDSRLVRWAIRVPATILTGAAFGISSYLYADSSTLGLGAAAVGVGVAWTACEALLGRVPTQKTLRSSDRFKR